MICIHTECPATSSNPPSRMERCAVTMRVLVADDDVVFRAGLASLLAGNGFDVVRRAGTGPGAVELVRAS